MCFDLAFQNRHLCAARALFVLFVRERRGISSVMSGPYAFARATRRVLGWRGQHVRMPPPSRVEDHFTFLECGEHRRIAAAERCEECFCRNAAGLTGLVEVRGDRIPGGGGRTAACARTAGGDCRLAVGDAGCCSAVLLGTTSRSASPSFAVTDSSLQ